MAEGQKQFSPEEEIRELERKLAEKKRELAEGGAPEKEEKEVFREVLKSHIEASKPAEAPAPAVSAPSVGHILTDDMAKKTDNVAQKNAREEQIRALIEIALTRTIQDAVKVAQKSTPYLVDELHDHLVDDYYQKLVDSRKLPAL
jgi:hypothetical protein